MRIFLLLDPRGREKVGVVVILVPVELRTGLLWYIDVGEVVVVERMFHEH